MDKAKIDRINALARKAKAGPLTPEELAERDALRKEYLEAVRKNFRAQMDRIVIVEPDGTRQRRVFPADFCPNHWHFGQDLL